MELRSILSTRKWYMEYVTLDYTEDDKISKMLFPCYQWLTSAEPSIQLRAAKGMNYEKYYYELIMVKCIYIYIQVE